MGLILTLCTLAAQIYDLNEYFEEKNIKIKKEISYAHVDFLGSGRMLTLL